LAVEIIGPPFTRRPYAGVARRTTRHVYWYGAAGMVRRQQPRCRVSTRRHTVTAAYFP